MQLSEFNRNRIFTIKGNTHDGYDVFLKDGRTFHCRTKLQTHKTVLLICYYRVTNGQKEKSHKPKGNLEFVGLIFVLELSL